MGWSVLRYVAESSLKSDAGGIGIGARQCLSPSQRVGLGEREAPRSPVAAKRLGRESQKLLLLLIVEHPVQVGHGDVCHKRGGVYISPHGSEHRPRPGQVTLGKVGGDHCNNRPEVARRECPRALSRGQCLCVATAGEQWPGE